MEMTLEEGMRFAKRVAFRMWKDPEAESAAGFGLWRAWRTFDASRNVPLRRWIAFCVRQRVWQEWRKLKVHQQKDDVWWESVAEAPPHEAGTFSFDFRVLVEKHLLRWPWDVVARKYGWTLREAKARVAEAERRFRCSMNS